MASSTENNNEKLTLKSSDGEEFLVEKQVALQSTLIQSMLDSDCSSANTIPLPKIDAKTLALVLEYCKKHANASSSKQEELNSFDSEFLKDLEFGALFHLVLAANFLEIKGLLDIMAQKIADTIKGMPHQEVRKVFNIENDYTPEEEAAVREENKWAFEGFP
ncbi:SKP1-like protein 14 [Rhododendron vialii]|uniref:SKP1-like protein 14 n=1 Tax=Rhododendron vialii TaxID=182163 RepID=UPI00265ECEE8|nr:SKP1-like protein 14 [Rhododendron vialii]